MMNPLGGTQVRTVFVALLCISLSKICLEILRNGSLLSAINSAGSVIGVLNKLQFGMLCDFYNTWRENGWSVEHGDFQEALEKTRTKAVKSPTSVIRIGESPLWEVPGNPMTGPSAPGEYTDF